MRSGQPSIAELRVRCQAHKWEESRGLTRLNRHVSIYVTALAVRTSLSANTITVCSIGAGLMAAVCLAWPAYSTRLMGVGLLYLSFLLDQVDGEVARFHNATSLIGSYLDEIRHLLIYPAPMAAISLGLFLDGATPLIVIAGLCTALSLVIIRFNRNVGFLLLGKKVLFEVNGRIESRGHVPRRRSDERARASVSRGRSLARRAIAAAFYVSTNQVALLVLILLFQLAVAWTSAGARGGAFAGYASLVVAVAIFDTWGLARGRLDHSTGELVETLEQRAR